MLQADQFSTFARDLVSTTMTFEQEHMEHVAEGLEKIVAGSLRQESSSEAVVLAWPLACGPAVAGRTRALDCVHGILRVEVPDAGWRAELQTLLPQYLNAIARYT